jgi:hypothetical protein
VIRKRQAAERFFSLVVLLVPLIAGGCMQTSYQPMNQTGPQPAESESLFERRVDYRLSDAFFETAPSCAAVVTNGKDRGEVSAHVERAVERHLATRLPRVIGGAGLRRVERRLGIDMQAIADRRVFARSLRCGALVEIHLTQVQDDYMVLWAQRSLTIGLVMTRMSDGKTLWQSRHAARRGDGGLPISIIDLPISAARAGMVTQDPELFASIADDAVRRMMKTLPDIRNIDPRRGSLAKF